MKTIYILFLALFFSIPQSFGQNSKLAFGLNGNPFRFIEGEIEGVGMIKFSNRITSKLSIGVNYPANTGFKSRCGRIDDVENRQERGGYSKLTTDYTLIKFNDIYIYGGAGIFYTKFQTRGISRNSQVELEESGDIFAIGLELGGRIESTGLITLDLGFQTFWYRGDNYQVGIHDCLGTIPGFGTSYKRVIGSVYINILFGK